MSRGDYFLMSREWSVLRMRALERDGARCACCGKTAAAGLVVNVDHIKPRARYPELALTLDNLQVLCDVCNRGKGNTFETDWRRAKAKTINTRYDLLFLGVLLDPNSAQQLPEFTCNSRYSLANELAAVMKCLRSLPPPRTTAALVAYLAGTDAQLSALVSEILSFGEMKGWAAGMIDLALELERIRQLEMLAFMGHPTK